MAVDFPTVYDILLFSFRCKEINEFFKIPFYFQFIVKIKKECISYTFPLVVKSYVNIDFNLENIKRFRPVTTNNVSWQIKTKNQENETLQIKILKVPDNIGLQIKILERLICESLFTI